MSKITKKLSLRPVRSLTDAKFLFDLLQERDKRANISHKKMPTYASHIKFIESKPYKKWYVIIMNDSDDAKKVGSIYLSKTDYTAIGESHGGGVGVILDGCPPKLEITEEDIQKELDKRRPGQVSSADMIFDCNIEDKLNAIIYTVSFNDS